MKLTMSDIDRIAAMVDAGNKIPAIKEFRRLTDWSLYDSKQFVAPTVDSTGDQFRIKAMTEFISSPAELLAEFKVHVHKLEQIIAQFAELCDGFQAETPPPTERAWTGDWRVLRVGDSVKYRGTWHEVTAVESPEYDGVMPIAIRSTTSKEFWLAYGDEAKDFREVMFK